MPVDVSWASAPLIEQFAGTKLLRTGSLIVSIFGDSVLPRGGEVWLGSIIAALAPLGISERLVRTAVYRLVQDGVLTNTQVGRRSYYSLTEAGRRQFNEATQRIYASPERTWGGEWCLVLTSGLDPSCRKTLRKTLAWLGFGQFSADVLAHPAPDLEQLQAQLRNDDPEGRCVVMTGAKQITGNHQNMAQLVGDAWQLDRLQDAYSSFIRRFVPVLTGAQQNAALDNEDAFYIRTFAVHEYRKILLRDPALPSDLLPETWPGREAYALIQKLYRTVVQPAEIFVSERFENETGALPPPAGEFSNRFGGLS